jgi:hypothetical protein
VNGAAVAESCLLEDGDSIQVGEVILRFQRKAAKQKSRVQSPKSKVAVVAPSTH